MKKLDSERVVQVLDKLANDMRPSPAGPASAPASKDTVTDVAGRQAAVLAHIATMYVDVGNTERAKATLVEATHATTQVQKVMLAGKYQQGMHGAMGPVVSSPLRESMVARDLSSHQQTPSQRPSVLVVLWPVAGAAFGFVGRGLIKPRKLDGKRTERSLCPFPCTIRSWHVCRLTSVRRRWTSAAFRSPVKRRSLSKTTWVSCLAVQTAS
jgi:hypothetical protein